MTLGDATCSPEKGTKGCEEAISAKRVFSIAVVCFTNRFFHCNLKKFDLSIYFYDVIAELQVPSMLQRFTKEERCKVLAL